MLVGRGVVVRLRGLGVWGVGVWGRWLPATPHPEYQSYMHVCVCVCVCVCFCCVVLYVWNSGRDGDLNVGRERYCGPHSWSAGASPFPPSPQKNLPFPEVKDIVGPRCKFAGALTRTRTHCRDHSCGWKSQRFPKTNSLPLPLISRQPSPCV